MSQSSRSKRSGFEETDKFNSLSTSVQMAAVKLKSANKYIFRALLSIASAALLIRLIGMVNQIVVSARFGAGASMDAYFVASNLPILLAQLIVGAIESSVIPIYARVRLRGSKEQSSILFSSLLNILFLGSFLSVVLMLVLRKQFILLSAPGLDPYSTMLASNLAFFIFPVLLLSVIEGFLESILNTEGQFGWPAYAGVLVPLTTTTLVLVFGRSLGVVMLCIGMVVGLCLQLCVIYVRARRAKIHYRPIIDWRNPEIVAVLMIAWPALLTALISQASPLVDQIFASYLSQGSISAINYSLKLYSVPIGVIFASVGRAVLPYLSRQAAIKDMKAFKETLRLYVWAVGIGSMILSAFMIILAHPIVRILFQHGAFTPADTNATSITLIGFLIGLTPMGVGFVLVKAFSALGKTHVLLYVTLFSIFANALFDYIFARWWQSFGIALSTSAVYFCTAVIVLVTLHRTIGNIHLFSPPSEIHKVILKLGLGRYYSRWIIWRRKITQFFNIPEHTRQSIIRFILAIVVFIGGVGGVILNDLTALKAAFGSILILALLRFRLLLLLIWIMIDVFIGSSVSFFNGSNFDSGLTLPVVLLMFYFPVKQTFKRMPALALLLIYLFWVLASIFVSAISIGAFLISWFIFLDFVAVSVLTINVLTTQRRLTLVVDTILLLSMIIAVYGIYGYITKQNGIPDAQIPSLFRISSVFSQTPTALAYFLTVVIPLSFYRTTTLGGFKRIFGWVITVLLLGTLVLTFSRGAFIAIAVSILILIIFLPSRKMRFGMISGIVVFGALVAAVVAVGNIPVFSRFFNTDVSTLNGRTYLWNAIIAHFDPTHVLGNGLNASDALLTALNIGNGGGVIATAPHNLFLGTLYDHGVVGLFLLTLTFIVLAASLINGIRKTTGDRRMLFVTALAVLASMLVQALESNEIWNQSVGIYFWIVMSLPFALCWSIKQKLPPEVNPEISDEEDTTVPRLRTLRLEKPKQITHA